MARKSFREFQDDWRKRSGGNGDNSPPPEPSPMPKNMIFRVPNGEEVLHWPEFLHLAHRLGIDLEQNTQRVVIDLDSGEPVQVIHEHTALDCTFEEDEEEDAG